MRFIPTAFAPSTAVGATRPTVVANRCHVQQRKALTNPNRKTPTMVSATSIVTELFGAGVLGFGTYYLFFRDEPESTETAKEDAPTSPAAVAEKKLPVKEEPEGIIGLSGSTSKKEVSELRIPTPKTPPPVTPPPFDTIGVDINDYLDSGDAGPMSEKQRRLEEELSFATEALSDLADCDGVVVIDHAGDVVWVTGELVGDTVTIGPLANRVQETREPETLNVEDNMGVPFLKPEVRNVAALPIGETGAILVVASRSQNFFDEVEKRIANAVCSRLAHFLSTPPSVGA